MKKTDFAKYANIGLLVAGVVAFTAPSAEAVSDTINTNVQISPAIAITGVDSLVFGTFSAPTSGLATWTVAATDNTMTEDVTTDSVDFITDDHSRGTFDVTGANAASYTISTSVSSAFSGTGVTLTAINTFPTTPGTLSGSGAQTVQVGGTVTIAVGAASGLRNGSIEMTVNYE